MGIHVSHRAHRNADGMSCGAFSALFHTRRWHSRALTSCIHDFHVAGARLLVVRATLGEASLCSCGREISTLAAQREPAPAQLWTADHSIRSPPSHWDDDSCRANTLAHGQLGSRRIKLGIASASHNSKKRSIVEQNEVMRSGSERFKVYQALQVLTR